MMREAATTRILDRRVSRSTLQDRAHESISVFACDATGLRVQRTVLAYSACTTAGRLRGGGLFSLFGV